jgi:hypothetical protein
LITIWGTVPSLSDGEPSINCRADDVVVVIASPSLVSHADNVV